MHPVLEKYRTLIPVSDNPTVDRLLAILITLPKTTSDAFAAADAHAGRFYLFKHSSAPDRVLEYVPDIDSDSSVTSLYTEHPMFGSRQSLIEARKEIIRAIDEIFMSVPNSTTVMDEGRGKQFRLPELGTGQLMDILSKISGGGALAKL